jgi:hypothetical protein
VSVTSACEPLLRHDPDLLRERRPPHRPRVHHGHRRRAGPLAPFDRRRGVLPHRHRRARLKMATGGRRQLAARPPSTPSSPRDRYRQAWDLLQISTTTSSAPPSPDTSTRCSLHAEGHDNGHIYSGTYEGWYCVPCEAYYNDDELSRTPRAATGCARDPQASRSSGLSEENWFFAVRVRAAACSTGTRPTRTPCSPRASATRRSA